MPPGCIRSPIKSADDPLNVKPFFNRIYNRFIRIRGTPREIARGFALGLFIGFSPTMGFQIAMGVFIAALLKWNKFAAAIGVQVTNPLTAPFVYGFTYLVGAKMIGLEQPFIRKDAFDLNNIVAIFDKAPDIILALTIGGVVVGLPVAWAGYLISYSAVEKYQTTIKEKLYRKKENIKDRMRVRKKRKKKKTKP